MALPDGKNPEGMEVAYSMAEEMLAARIRQVAAEFERGKIEGHVILSEFSLTPDREAKPRLDRSDVATRLRLLASRFEAGDVWVIDLPAKVYDCLYERSGVTLN